MAMRRLEIPDSSSDEDSSSGDEVEILTPRYIVEDNVVESFQSKLTLSSSSCWTRHDNNNNNNNNNKYRVHNIEISDTLYHKLFDYQKEGVAWLASLSIGGVLGDDMGLGKTFQTLACIQGKFQTRSARTCLIVSPKSVLSSWETSAREIVGADIVVLQNRPHVERYLTRNKSSTCVVVITSYNLVLSCVSELRKCNWDIVVLDEGHTIKKKETQTSKACYQMLQPHTFRLLLTGTPLLNRLDELWNIFHFATGEMKNFKTFREMWAKPIEASRDKEASAFTIQHGERKAVELRAKLQPFLLQRKKEDVLAHILPEKQELVIWTKLHDLQRALYQSYVEGDQARRIVLTGENPLAGITFLKSICNHPYLVDKGRQLPDNPDLLLSKSGKLQTLVSLVLRLKQQGHRTLVFSQSVQMLGIINKVLQSKGVNLLQLDGQSNNRQQLVDTFNDESSCVDVMLLSIKAGGVGLTLTGATRVIINDPSWTPAEDSQAIDRAYRIGQTKKVVAYRLITAGTVEEKIYERQVHKEGLRRSVFIDESADRLFNKVDLKKVFTLAPEGQLDMASKIEEEAKKNRIKTDWSSHDFLLNLDGVLGYSRHDVIFSRKSTKRDEFETAQENEESPPSKPSPKFQHLGKAGRVLVTSDVNIDQNTASSTTVPSSTNTGPKGAMVAAREQIKKGHHKSALYILISLKRDPDRWDTVEDADKAEVLRLISQTANTLDLVHTVE